LFCWYKSTNTYWKSWGLAFRGRVPIDVIAKGGRYTGEKEGGGKYVPTLDPVMMAAEAGKGVREAN